MYLPANPDLPFLYGRVKGTVRESLRRESSKLACDFSELELDFQKRVLYWTGLNIMIDLSRGAAPVDARKPNPGAR
jgi:hypothetical protein